MDREATLLAGGIGLGAALMYILDPDRGRRRRALMRDQFVSAGHRLPDAVGAIARDLSNRTRGLVAEAGASIEETFNRGRPGCGTPRYSRSTVGLTCPNQPRPRANRENHRSAAAMPMTSEGMT